MDFLEEKNRKANEKKKSPSNKSGTDQMMLEEDKEEGGGQCVLGCGWMVSMHLQALIVCWRRWLASLYERVVTGEGWVLPVIWS